MIKITLDYSKGFVIGSQRDGLRNISRLISKTVFGMVPIIFNSIVCMGITKFEHIKIKVNKILVQKAYYIVDEFLYDRYILLDYLITMYLD